MNELAVILVHWKDKEKTKNCLEQVLKWDRLKPIIYLVQNEESMDQFLEYPEVISILSEKNLGYGGGNNLALDQSIQKTVYSLLLNTDASIEEIEVDKLIATMQSDSNIFSTGPLIEECSETSCRLYYGGRDIASHLNTRMETQDFGSNLNSTDWIKVDYTIGTILLLDNTKLKSIGLFDEDYFFSGEVADLCFRANQEGYYSTTSLKALGKHSLGDITKRKTMYKYYNLRNRGLYIFKHKQGIKKQCKWWFYMAKDALYFATKGRSKEAKSSFFALLHTLFHLYGNRNNQFL